jgi:hypothetical protein
MGLALELRGGWVWRNRLSSLTEHFAEPIRVNPSFVLMIPLIETKESWRGAGRPAEVTRFRVRFLTRAWFLMAICLLTTPVTGRAQVLRVEVSPQVGYFFFNGDSERDIEVNEDDLLYALRLGVVLPGGHWGIEGSTGLVRSQAPLPLDRERANSFYVGGAVLYHLVTSNRLTPFLAAGAEILDYDHSGAGDEARFNLVGGGGLKLEMSPRVALRLDGRLHAGPAEDRRVPDNPEFWLHHAEVAAGLTWKPPIFGE